MKVAVACDHGGFPLKDTVIAALLETGHQPVDFGTHSPDRVDFPDFIQKAGLAVQQGEADRGIVLCGSGVGACIAANKIKGVYAAICHDTYSAHQGVEHDNMNVLCLGGRIIGPEVARELVLAFLSAHFFNTGNYKIRVDKILDIEKQR